MEKERKHLRTKLFCLLLLSVVLSACQSDLHEFEKVETKSFTIVDAHNWFEANAHLVGPREVLTRGMDGLEEVATLNPIFNWNIAEWSSNSEWEVIELPWEYEEREQILALWEVWQYAQANNSVPENVMRLVIMQHRETGATYGFKMKVAPDLNFLLSYGGNLSDNKLLDRSSRLSGIVLFYTLDGVFVNGWRYHEGEITAELVAKNEINVEVVSTPTTRGWWNDDPNFDELLCEIVIVGCRPPSPQAPILSLPPFCLNTIPPSGGGGMPDLGGGGGSGGGGGPAGNDGLGETEPQKRIDCPPSAAQNSTNIINVLGNSNPYVDENMRVITQINALQRLAGSQNVEHGLAVQRCPDWGDLWVHNQGNNANQRFINSGTATQVEIGTNVNTFLVAHTHPAGTNAAPSPLDAIFLANAFRDDPTRPGTSSPNIAANVIFAANGDMYMVFVNNRNAFSTFVNNSANSGFFQNNGSMFQRNSVWERAYNDAFDRLRSQGFSSNDAQSFALSYVLSRFNTGLKIYHRRGTGNFREQYTQRSGNNFTPTICP